MSPRASRAGRPSRPVSCSRYLRPPARPAPMVFFDPVIMKTDYRRVVPATHGTQAIARLRHARGRAAFRARRATPVHRAARAEHADQGARGGTRRAPVRARPAQGRVERHRARVPAGSAGDAAAGRARGTDRAAVEPRRNRHAADRVRIVGVAGAAAGRAAHDARALPADRARTEGHADARPGRRAARPPDRLRDDPAAGRVCGHRHARGARGRVRRRAAETVWCAASPCSCSRAATRPAFTTTCCSR